jgi:hypothetical protein
MGQLRRKYCSRDVSTAPIYFGTPGGRLFVVQGLFCVGSKNTNQVLLFVPQHIKILDTWIPLLAV